MYFWSQQFKWICVFCLQSNSGFNFMYTNSDQWILSSNLLTCWWCAEISYWCLTLNTNHLKIKVSHSTLMLKSNICYFYILFKCFKIIFILDLAEVYVIIFFFTVPRIHSYFHSKVATVLLRTHRKSFYIDVNRKSLSNSFCKWNKLLSSNIA